MRNVNKFVILFLTLVLLLLTLYSCKEQADDVEVEKVKFVCIYDNNWADYSRRILIYRDMKTDLIYVVYGKRDCQSISPLYRTPTEVYTYEQWKEDYLEIETNGNVD